MDYRSAGTESNALYDLLLAYYREGEDADTPEAELEDFISYLQGLLNEGVLLGIVAFQDDEPVGFVLYALDDEKYPFSELPGFGTIAEIGVVPTARRTGLGQELVQLVENGLCTEDFYVCAYPAAQAFWRKCGYQSTGKTAGNGLPILTRHISKAL